MEFFVAWMAIRLALALIMEVRMLAYYILKSWKWKWTRSLISKINIWITTYPANYKVGGKWEICLLNDMFGTLYKNEDIKLLQSKVLGFCWNDNIVLLLLRSWILMLIFWNIRNHLKPSWPGVHVNNGLSHFPSWRQLSFL